MKKIIMKLFIVAVVFAMAVPLVSASTLYSPNLNNKAELILGTKEFDDGWKEYLSNKYGENYSEIFVRNAWSVENAKKISNLFLKNNVGEIIYPSYIGGLYINDNDYLVVQIVDADVPSVKTAERSIYDNVLSIDDNAILEHVKYSYTELEKVYDELVKEIAYNSSVSNISAIYIDGINNRVVVELKNYTNEEIIKFKSTVMDSLLISYEKGVENTNYANLNPGAKVGLLSCSYGYRARLSSTRVGILTAGHCTPNGVGTNISGIGTVQRWQRSGDIDAAWIETTSLNTPTNTLAYNNPNGPTGFASTSVETFFVIGARVGKVGQASGWSDGTITNVNYTTTGQPTISGLIKTNAWAQQGDSGGFVFANPLFFTGAHTTYGIVQGGPNPGGAFHFTRADRINSAFGLSRY